MTPHDRHDAYAEAHAEGLVTSVHQALDGAGLLARS